MPYSTENGTSIDASAPLSDLGPDTAALVRAYVDEVLAGKRSRRLPEINDFLLAAAMSGRLKAKRPRPLVFQRWVAVTIALRAVK